MTPFCQHRNACFDDQYYVLPQSVVSYDFAADQQIESGVVAKRSKQKVDDDAGRGRALWDGARLIEVRKHAGIATQKEFARISGVSEGDISRHESNSPLSNPRVDTVGRLALALGLPLYVLMQPPGSPIPRPGDGREAAGLPEGHILLESIISRVDVEDPSEDSWRGDVLKAVAVLTRALRRMPDSSAPGNASHKA